MGTYSGRIPYGDNFIIPTSAVDNIAKRLYDEQQAKDARQQKEMDLLDKEFNNDTAKMKAVDIPLFVEKVANWKRMAKDFKKNTPRDQQEFISKQAQIQKAYADAKQHAVGSSADKIDENEWVKRVREKPTEYDKDAAKFLIARKNTPQGAYKLVLDDPLTGIPVTKDMTNISDNVLFKGSNTDFGPMLTSAIGKVQDVGNEIVSSETPLTKTVARYKMGNNALEFIQQFHDRIKGSRAEDDFNIKHTFSDEQTGKIVSDYQELMNNPEYKKAGIVIPDIPASLMLTKTGKNLALLAMQNAVMNPPILSLGRVVKNVEKTMEAQEAMRKRLMAYNSRLITGRQRTNPIDGAKYNNGNLYDAIGVDKEVVFSIPNSFAKGTVVDGQVLDDKGNPYTGEIELPTEEVPSEIFSVTSRAGVKGLSASPTQKLRVKNGVVQSLVSGKGVIDRTAIENYQLDYSKQTQKEEKLDFSRANKPQQTNIPTYSRKGLKDAKWKDSQIEDAIKKGKIKVTD